MFEHVFCSGHCMHWSGLDEPQAFTSVEMCEWHWKFQATVEMRLEDVPQKFRKAHWLATDKFGARYKRMAMGSTNSVLLLMMVHLKKAAEALQECPLTAGFRCLNAREVRLSGVRLSSRHGVYYIHVDGVVTGHDFLLVSDAAIEAIANKFREAGL